MERDGQLRGRSWSRAERELADDRDLKAIPISLPPLPPPTDRDSSLEAGDWIIQLAPLIGDLSRNAASWWKQVMGITSNRYYQWLHADPLARLRISAPDQVEMPEGYDRLDQRVTSLLLNAVPKSVKDEVVASRSMTTPGILFQVFRTYQPGGLGERSKLLEDLTRVPTVASYADVVASLRLWKRKANRASELCAQLPDPLLMVRTLDGIAKLVVEGSPQAAFRLSTFRMNHALDVRPTMDSLWLFHDLLLAEAELAMHSMVATTSSDPATPTKPSVKAMQPTPSPGKTSDGTSSTPRPCKFWLTEAGCRQGQKCRWPHSWDGVLDKSTRCWTCSSTQHQQSECPTKTPVKTPVGGEGESKDGAKKGKGKGKQSKGGKSASKDSPGDEKKDEKPASEDAKGNKGTTTTAIGTSSTTTEKSKPESGGTGSGTTELLQEATKLLRSLNIPSVKMISLQEVTTGSLEKNNQVLLDSGATHALRKAESVEEWNEADPTLVALAQGTTSRLRIKKGTNILLADPTDDSFGSGILPMGMLSRIGFSVKWTDDGCQLHGVNGEMVEADVSNGCPMLESQLGMKLMKEMELQSKLTMARLALMKAVIQQPHLLGELTHADPELLLSVMLKKEFPDVPDNIIEKVVPKWQEIQGEQLPWNRRQRRSIDRAERIVVHLYSGQDVRTWKALEGDGTVVLCLDKLINPKMNLMSDVLFLYLMKLAVAGKVAVVLGGPPCRTVSACRYAGDNGPPPLRSEEQPYGMIGISPRQQEMVEEDVTLMLRMKLLYMTAEHYKPMERLQVMFGMEQPQDPREYRSSEDVEKHRYMSVWRTQAWQSFQERYKMQLTNFEQGAFGHCKPKPTTMAHNIQGIEQLDGAKAPPDLRQGQAWKELSLEERMKESASWSQWAPGLKAALVEAIRRGLQQEIDLRNLGTGDESVAPVPRLCPISEVALQKWKRHVLNDHQPSRRDCRVCAEAIGRSRPHRRIEHPMAYCLSLDLSGRMKAGRDQFKTKHKYVMVGCYTFPTTLDDLPLAGPAHGREPEDVPLPALGEMTDEDGVEADYEDGELPRLEEDDDVLEEAAPGDEQAKQTAQTSYDNWKKLVQECKNVKVKTLTFVEVIPSRHTNHVMEGLAKIYSRVRSMGLEVLRIHADRAKEFTSKALQTWSYDRGIVATYTTGSDWKSNGRAEAEIGVVKRRAKILMKAHDISEEKWPILVRHAAERRLRWQLHQVGFPVPELLPFDAKVLVKRKSWNNRYGAWRWERAPGRIRGPDPWSSLTSGGYCVEMEAGNYVASTDVIVEQLEPGEADAPPVVEAREAIQDQPLAAPRRRNSVQAAGTTSRQDGVGFQLGGGWLCGGKHKL